MLLASFTPISRSKSISHLLVTGLASAVPHVLVRIDVAYKGICAEENRLQNE